MYYKVLHYFFSDFCKTAGVSSHCYLVNTFPVDCCLYVGIEHTGLKALLAFLEVEVLRRVVGADDVLSRRVPYRCHEADAVGAGESRARRMPEPATAPWVPLCLITPLLGTGLCKIF